MNKAPTLAFWQVRRESRYGRDDEGTLRPEPNVWQGSTVRTLSARWPTQRVDKGPRSGDEQGEESLRATIVFTVGSFTRHFECSEFTPVCRLWPRGEASASGMRWRHRPVGLPARPGGRV